MISDLNQKPYNPLAEDIKEVCWAIFLIDGIILLLGVAVSVKTAPWAMWFFVGLAAIATAAISGLLLLNFLAVWLYDWWVARRSDRPPRA